MNAKPLSQDCIDAVRIVLARRLAWWLAAAAEDLQKYAERMEGKQP